MKDVVIEDASARVTTAWPRNNKLEDEFGTRLEPFAGVRSGVFAKQFFVNQFLRRIFSKAPVVMDDQVHRLPPKDHVNLSVTRRIYPAENMTY